ncbi:MAG: aminopeptidase [Planctomycetes bacterium]|nr:aminopeptidase [Planctomycetota bacterium]
MTLRHPLQALLLPCVLLGAVAAQRPAAVDPRGFTIEIDLARQPVLSQDRTGTCWSFATVSFLESEITRLHGETVDLSEMFAVRCAYQEKARRFVMLQGKAQFSQGGLSHDVITLARNYGLAPQSAYDGLCGESTQHDHSELEQTLTAMLGVYAGASRPSEHWQAAISGVLDAYLGEMPATFEIDGHSYTPQTYAQQIARLPLDDYVELMSFQSEGFGHRAELLVPDNWMRDGNYWNMPIEELVANVDFALEHGFSIAIDCDVSEPGASAGRGLFQLPAALEKRTPIPDALRQRQFDDHETTDDHLMHIVGRAKHDDGRTFYVVKNSWGSQGPFDGLLMMSRNYLALKTLAVMIHVDGLRPETRARFGRPVAGD